MSEATTDKKSTVAVIADILTPLLATSNSGDLGTAQYEGLLTEHFGITNETAKAVHTADKAIANALCIAAVRHAATLAGSYTDPVNEMPKYEASVGDIRATVSARMVTGGLPKDGETPDRKPALTVSCYIPTMSKSTVRTHTVEAHAAFAAACGANS